MKRSNRSMIGMFLLALLAACANPADKTPKAVISSAATPFEVARFPKASFISTAIRSGAAGNGAHTVTGNLELRGVTKAITFPAIIRVEADYVTVDSEFAINRKDFGIVYVGRTDDLIRDEVALKLAIKAPRPKLQQL